MRPVNVASYWVMDTNCTGMKPFLRSKPLKSGMMKARVICRARSGRKLKKITLSPFSTVVRGLPSFSITVGIMNSSVLPLS